MPIRTRSLAVAGVVGIALAIGSLAALPAQSVTRASTGDTYYWSSVQTAAVTSATRIEGKALAVLSDGVVSVAGSFSSNAVFPTGPNADDSIVLTSTGNFDAFIAGFDPATGFFTWAQRAGGTGSDIAYGVAPAHDDTVIVTGYISGVAHFPNGVNADDSITLTADGDDDIFVAALDTSTRYFTWAQRAGGSVTGWPRMMRVIPLRFAMTLSSSPGSSKELRLFPRVRTQMTQSYFPGPATVMYSSLV